MSQPTNIDADLKQAQLASAQQAARQATLAADKIELELQQAREAAKKGPAPKNMLDELKAVKDLLPAASSAATSGTTFGDKGPNGISFLYEVLPEAVKALRRAIYGAEFEYQGKTHQDVTLIYVDDDLSSLAAQYHALLLRIQTAYAIYSDLSAEPDKLREAPAVLDRVTAGPPDTTTAATTVATKMLGLGAVLPGLQVIAAGLALAQGVAQVFAIKRSIATSDVAVDKGVFQDLLKANLQSDGRNSAVQPPSLSWDTSASTSTKLLRLAHALGDLMRLTERPKLKQAACKDLLAALNNEIAAILKAVQEFGYGHAQTIEELADLLTSKERPHLLLSADLLHASVAVVTKDQAFRRDSEISVHPAIVMTFRILKPDGAVVAADTCVVRRKLDYKL
jgi:hypothetical protein